MFGDDAGVLGVLAGVDGGHVGQFGLAARRRRARDGDVGLLQGDLGGALRRADGRLDALAELGRPDQEQVLLLLRRDQHVVLVLALLLRAVLSVNEASIARQSPLAIRHKDTFIHQLGSVHERLRTILHGLESIEHFLRRRHGRCS